MHFKALLVPNEWKKIHFAWNAITSDAMYFRLATNITVLTPICCLPCPDHNIGICAGIYARDMGIWAAVPISENVT